MSKNETRTRARVRILLEVDLPDVWGDDCLLSQVYKQSADSARNIITQRIASSLREIRIIGEPEVKVILVEE